MRPARTHRHIIVPEKWEEIPHGTWIKAEFEEFIHQQCQKMFGYHLVKIGALSAAVDCSCSPIRHHCALDNQSNTNTQSVMGDPQDIPFKSASIDLCILAHTLDFSADPHQILREVDRVLTQGGWVILCGFNSMSLTGLGRILPSKRESLPCCAQMFLPDRISDWLHLLGFEILTRDFCGFSCFGPHSHVGGWREDVGRKFFKNFGSVYMISARKRRAPLTPTRLGWSLKKRRRFTSPGIARISE